MWRLESSEKEAEEEEGGADGLDDKFPCIR